MYHMRPAVLHNALHIFLICHFRNDKVPRSKRRLRPKRCSYRRSGGSQLWKVIFLCTLIVRLLSASEKCVCIIRVVRNRVVY